MDTQIISPLRSCDGRERSSALYLVIAIVAYSLLPFASSTAWAELQGDTGSRFRQFFQFSWPIAFLLATDFVVWDEAFVNLYQTDWGQESKRTRGLIKTALCRGYRISPKIKTVIGYMNQYIPSRSNANDRMNHILSVTVFLDSYKS